MTKPLEPQSTALDQEGVLKDALENIFPDKSDDISVNYFSNAAIIRRLAQEIAQEKDPSRIRKLKRTLTTNIIEGFVYHWTEVFFINDQSTNKETRISNTKKYVRERVKAKNLALDDDESERLINEGLAAVERDAQVTNATAAVGHAADAALAAAPELPPPPEGRIPGNEREAPAPDWGNPIAEPEPGDDAERVRRALRLNLDELPPEDESGPVANKESDPLALPARLEGVDRGPQASVQTSRVNVPRRRVSRPTTITPFPEPVEAPALPETPSEPIQRATLSSPPPSFFPPEPEASPENALVNEAKIFFRENPNIGIMSYYRSILTPAAAAEFAKAVELRELTLDNITNISPETARELVKAPKLEKLILEKITSLSPELEAALTPTDREITIILADGKKVTLKPKENPGFFSKGGRGERMAIGSASFVGKHAPKLWEVPISGLGKAGKGIASLGKKMPKPGKKTVLGLSAAAALTVGGIYREAIKEGVSYLVSCVTSSSEATDTTAPSPASAPATPSKEAAEFTPPQTVTAKFPGAEVMNGGIFVGYLKFGDYESAGGFLTRARKLIVMADTKSDNTYYYVSDEPIDIHTDTGKEFSFTYVGDEYSKVVQNYSTPLSEDELAALRAKKPTPKTDEVENLCHGGVCVVEPKELACRPSVKAKGESFARKCNDGRVITYRTDVINPDTNTPGPGIIFYSK